MKFESYAAYIKAMVYCLNFQEVRRSKEQIGQDFYGTNLLLDINQTNYNLESEFDDFAEDKIDLNLDII
jgi:hypothetical protein